MKSLTLTVKEFDAKRAEVETVIRDWVERECTSFDDAVDRVSTNDEGSIWDMPAIDSKAATGVLVELEAVLGCKLPTALIKKGGYDDAEAIVAGLTAAILGRCSDAAGGGSGVDSASRAAQLEQVIP